MVLSAGHSYVPVREAFVTLLVLIGSLLGFFVLVFRQVDKQLGYSRVHEHLITSVAL